MEYDAVEEPLVDVTIKIYQRHSFKEGVDAHTDDEARDGVDMVFMTMALVVMMPWVMFEGLFATLTMVVSVLHTACEMLKKELDEEADEDRRANLEMVGRCGVSFEVHVWHKIDKTARKKECTTKN